MKIRNLNENNMSKEFLQEIADKVKQIPNNKNGSQLNLRFLFLKDSKKQLQDELNEFVHDILERPDIDINIIEIGHKN